MTNIKPSKNVPSTIPPFEGLNNLPTYGCFVIFLSVPVCFAPNSKPYKLYCELFGGSLKILPIEGVGTDVTIYMRKLGLITESLD